MATSTRSRPAPGRPPSAPAAACMRCPRRTILAAQHVQHTPSPSHPGASSHSCLKRATRRAHASPHSPPRFPPREGGHAARSGPGSVASESAAVRRHGAGHDEVVYAIRTHRSPRQLHRHARTPLAAYFIMAGTSPPRPASASASAPEGANPQSALNGSRNQLCTYLNIPIWFTM